MHPSQDPNSHRLWQLIDVNFGTWRGAVRLLLSQTSWVLGRIQSWSAQDVARTQRFVFVCLGNINRSAFAAAVARQLGLPCVSIGLSTTTGAPATRFAMAQAQVQGYDLQAHQATDMSDYQYTPGDTLLVMEERHIGVLTRRGIPPHAIAMLGQWGRPMRLHLHDPDTLSPAFFSTCFTVIESAVRHLAAARQAGQS